MHNHKSIPVPRTLARPALATRLLLTLAAAFVSTTLLGGLLSLYETTGAGRPFGQASRRA